MPEEVLTVAELERFASWAASTGKRNTIYQTLARVCRHALALEAEVARLRQLPDLAHDLDALRHSDMHRRLVGYMDYLLAEIARLRQQVEGQDRPRVVCLCGSTRFKRQFIEANYRETMAGRIVLSVGWFSHADAHVYTPTEAEKAALDELHLRKIDLADEVFVLNVGGYVGDSTRREIAYALAHGKPVRYLESAQIDESWQRRHEVHEDDGEIQ